MWVLELALAVAALLALGWVLSACVCGCRNNHQKSELVGTAGVVKLRFDEEVPSPAPTTPASVKRASTQNSQRSLPEIPQPVGRHDSGDTASDLIYATVNIDEGATKTEPVVSTSRDHSYEHAYAKLQNENHTQADVPADQAAAGAEVAIIEPEPPSQAALESVVISASVAISGQLPSSQELPYITPPSPHPHPPPPPPSHPAPAADAQPPVLPHLPQPQHFSGDSTDSTKGYTSISVREPLSNIRAILTQNNKTQQHYATVSDDSDEMYAAIDDPNGSAGGGSDTYAQIAPQPQEPRRTPEPRHSLEREPTPRGAFLPSEPGSRRSAPPEASGAVASNHSRQASASSCSNSAGTLGSPKPEKRQANSPLPPPPAAPAPPDAKAERRKHEAPLAHASISRQQRISSTGDLHFSHDKHRRSLNEKHQRNNSCVSSSDFYGCNYPVEKHRFSSGDLIRPLVAKELNFDIDKPPEPARLNDNLYNSIEGPSRSDYSSAEANVSLTSDRVTESPSRNVEEMYAKVMKKTKSKLHPEELKTARKLTYANDNTINESSADRNPLGARFANDDPGYETIDRKRSVNHGYETITEKVRKISQNQDPGYETVRDIEKMSANANFSNNNLLNKLNHIALDSGPNSIIGSDPGYEHILKTNNCASDSDPNYEVLRNEPPTPPYATIAPNYNMQPTYSVINKTRSANNNDDAIVEPNYESMPHDAIYTTGSESDPNYESVRPKDPNYESVNSKDPNYESLRLKNNDPNYESVRSKDRFEPGRSKHPNYESMKSNDPNYESVRPQDPNYESVKYDINKEPPYASVAGASAGVTKDVHRSDSAAGYERIKPMTNRSSINGEGGTVDDYFQV